MKRNLLVLTARSLLAVLVAAAIPGTLSAQVCLGIPHASRGAVAASMHDQSFLTTYALSGTAALGSSLLVGAHAGVMNFGGRVRDIGNGTDLGVTLAYRLLSVGENASLCPQLDVGYQSFGVQYVLRLPVGFGSNGSYQRSWQRDLLVHAGLTLRVH